MEHKNRSHTSQDYAMVFSSLNYKLLCIGLFLVVAGFTAMYLENEASGFISLFISPIVIVAGYILVIFAIMKRSSSNPSTESHNVN